MTRILASLALSALLFSLASVASAGGWAVTTLDSIPQTIVAGQTYRIGFTMRQHGVTPYSNARPAIVITRGATHQEFAASAEGAPGHYVSHVTFPSEGEWTWSVDQAPFPMRQALGTLNVAAPEVATVRTRPPTELAFLAVLLPAALAAALGIVAGAKRQRRPAASAEIG